MNNIPDLDEHVRAQIQQCVNIGIPLKRLAEHAGVSRTTLWRWLNEDRAPQWATMRQVLQAADDLIFTVVKRREELQRRMECDSCE